jgi:hypothetical protein
LTRPSAITLHVLKQDALGRTELVACPEGEFVRRVACGGSLPLSRWLAHVFLARERRALQALRGLAGVPRLCSEPLPAELALAPSSNGRTARGEELLWREYVRGEPLHRTRELPEDFFERLEELVGELHARGVCHNDLHKEQNVVVGEDGWPHLIDFQLASVHRRRSRSFLVRAAEDLRHVRKHARRYTRDGRGPRGEPTAPRARGRRSWGAWLWRRAVKPLYLLATRGLLRTRDGEERRASAGPWPRWLAARGPRPSAPA